MQNTLKMHCYHIFCHYIYLWVTVNIKKSKETPRVGCLHKFCRYFERGRWFGITYEKCKIAPNIPVFTNLRQFIKTEMVTEKKVKCKKRLKYTVCTHLSQVLLMEVY